MKTRVKTVIKVKTEAGAHWDYSFLAGTDVSYVVSLLQPVKRREDDDRLAECPLCNSLDIGGANNTVSCYGCGLKITKPKPLKNAIDAWNTRNGKLLDT